MTPDRQHSTNRRRLRVCGALLLCALLSCLPGRNLRIGHCERTGASAVEVACVAVDEPECVVCCGNESPEPTSCCEESPEPKGCCGDEEPDDDCCHELRVDEQVLPRGDGGGVKVFAPDLPPHAFAALEIPALPPHARRTLRATGPPVRHGLRLHLEERRAVVLLI